MKGRSRYCGLFRLPRELVIQGNWLGILGKLKVWIEEVIRFVFWFNLLLYNPIKVYCSGESWAHPRLKEKGGKGVHEIAINTTQPIRSFIKSTILITFFPTTQPQAHCGPFPSPQSSDPLSCFPTFSEYEDTFCLVEKNWGVLIEIILVFLRPKWWL